MIRSSSISSSPLLYPGPIIPCPCLILRNSLTTYSVAMHKCFCDFAHPTLHQSRFFGVFFFFFTLSSLSTYWLTSLDRAKICSLLKLTVVLTVWRRQLNWWEHFIWSRNLSLLFSTPRLFILFTVLSRQKKKRHVLKSQTLEIKKINWLSFFG